MDMAINPKHTAYAVTTGIYSAYTVLVICGTREMAKRWEKLNRAEVKRIYGDSTDIEEFTFYPGDWPHELVKEDV